LAASPRDALALAKEHLRPAVAGNEERLKSLLKDLDDPKFAERQRAADALKQEKDAAIPALERFLAGEPSVEARKQADQILAALREPNGNPERLRQIRLLEVLERIGGEEVRKL